MIDCFSPERSKSVLRTNGIAHGEEYAIISAIILREFGCGSAALALAAVRRPIHVRGPGDVAILDKPLSRSNMAPPGCIFA